MWPLNKNNLKIQTEPPDTWPHTKYKNKRTLHIDKIKKYFKSKTMTETFEKQINTLNKIKFSTIKVPIDKIKKKLNYNIEQCT